MNSAAPVLSSPIWPCAVPRITNSSACRLPTWRPARASPPGDSNGPAADRAHSCARPNSSAGAPPVNIGTVSPSSRPGCDSDWRDIPIRSIAGPPPSWSAISEPTTSTGGSKCATAPSTGGTRRRETSRDQNSARSSGEDLPITSATLVHSVDVELVCVAHTPWPVDRTVHGVRAINAGSVSNPAAMDLRASYALVDAHEARYQVEHHRVVYDLEAVVAAIERSHHPSGGYITGHFKGDRRLWSANGEDGGEHVRR